MSYCHTSSGNGIDLSLGFHPQVATQISNFTNNCIATTVSSTCTPPTPADVGASNISMTSVDLTCSLTTGIAGYYWFYKEVTAPNYSNSGVLSATTTTFNLTGLLPNTQYEYTCYVYCTTSNAWSSTGSCTDYFTTKGSNCVAFLNLSGTQNNIVKTEQASINITSTEYITGSTTNVTYKAGTVINLNSNFEVVLGSEFLAHIVTCFTSSNPVNALQTDNSTSHITTIIHDDGEISFDFENMDITNIQKVFIKDIKGKIVKILTAQEAKTIHQAGLEKGLYFIETQTNTGSEYFKMLMP